MRSQVRWRLCWESELELSDHAELAEFFRSTYGKPFEDNRSWVGARPEFRAIAYDSGGIAAHIGLLRRFIRVGSVDLLVAELGLYGVRPDLERLGIAYSIRVLHPVLDDFGVPFGFGTVRHTMQKYVARLGRNGLAAVLSGISVRSTLRDARLDLPPTRTEDALVVVVPVKRSISDWPAGSIDRNGPGL
ncbi:NodA family N-acyltransferase [Mesorhizobium abyssinicae]|uniref:NodA family N-acyltransferase n=1 Tax=Mesorhizobium abyssinicae TaxID=1209958 RepID=UPI0033994FE5